MNFPTLPFVSFGMRQSTGKQAEWAREQFGRARVGDSRRTSRLVGMAARAAQFPSGKVTEVFTAESERQGAYDLLESGHVSADALALALGEVTAQRAAVESFAFVAVDGSSLSLSDRTESKDFGSVGAFKEGGRGLKVISALGLSPDGLPLGLFAQTWWARTQVKVQTRKEKKKRNRKRKTEEKETRYWLETITAASARASEAKSNLWFQLDREADCRAILLKLAETGQRFTVRGSWDRLIRTTGNDKQYLRQWLSRTAAGGNYLLDVTAGPGRAARRAFMVVRWGWVVLRLRDGNGGNEKQLGVSVVWAREEGTCPAGEKPLDWLLLTNTPVLTFSAAQYVIFGYTQRWRIGASSEGRITQSVKVRPRPKDSRPRSVGGTVERKRDGEALRHDLERRSAKHQVAA